MEGGRASLAGWRAGTQPAYPPQGLAAGIPAWTQPRQPIQVEPATPHRDGISRSVSASSLLSRHTDSHIPTLRYGGDEAAFTAAYDVTTVTALLKGVKAARTE